MFVALLMLWLMLVPMTGIAQPAQAEDIEASNTPAEAPASAPSIALMTIAPGEVYWQRFGHNTLLVTPPEGGEAVSYNFGYFDFEQPAFFQRFLLGRMLYQALAIPARLDVAEYVGEDRSVLLQSLALTPPQAQRLADALADAVTPANRDYLYEYFRANCSTRVRDALDAALDGELRRQTAGRSRGFTYRMHAARLAKDDFWLAIGIDLGLGPDTDRRLSFWEEMFIPEMLRRYVQDVVTQDGQPLVATQRVLHQGQAPEPAELAPDRRAGFALTGIAIAIGLLWLSSRARRGAVGARKALTAIATSLHLLFGLAGLLLLFLWLGTDHIAAHRNENLLLLSPLSLPLAIAWLRRRRGAVGHALAWLVACSAALGLVAKTLPDTFIQQNLHWCLLFLPIHVSLLVAWRRSSINR